MTPPTADRATAAASTSRDGAITRDAVLATALAIIDGDGPDALSMRRLAAALGRDPAILYRHAPNKAALLDSVAETVLAQLHVNPPTRLGHPAAGAAQPAPPPIPRMTPHQMPTPNPITQP
jgi:AcrR family transcriptional regulator